MKREPFGMASCYVKVKSKFLICKRSNAGAFVLTRQSETLYRTGEQKPHRLEERNYIILEKQQVST
jgi:hypothetical protein